MKRSRTRWGLPLRRPELLAFLLLAGPTLGCVSAGAYDSLSDELELLKTEKRRLVEASAGADRARVEAMETAEDLREERNALASEVKKLERKVKELEGALASHERARETAARHRELEDARFGPLRAELAPELAAGQVSMHSEAYGLRLVVAEELLFAPGSGDLSAGGQALVRRIALRVRDEDQRVEVEGGADAPPLRLTRGAVILRALSAGGIPNEQLRAGSFVDEEEEIVAEGGGPVRRGAEIRLLPNLGAGPGAVSAPANPPELP